jgi:hypothetical protein
MKKILSVFVAAVVVAFSVSVFAQQAVAQAPQVAVSAAATSDDGKIVGNEKIAAFLKEEFKIDYTPVDDGMDCDSKAKTPTVGAKVPENIFYVVNCQTGVKSSNGQLQVSIGWVPKSKNKLHSQIFFSVNNAISNNVSYRVDDKVVCKKEEKGITGCLSEFATNKNVLHTYFFYIGDNVFLAVSDLFSNQKEEAYKVAVEYSSRIKSFK